MCVLSSTIVILVSSTALSELSMNSCNSMTADRLSNLLLLSIERDFLIDYENIIDCPFFLCFLGQFYIMKEYK